MNYSPLLALWITSLKNVKPKNMENLLLKQKFEKEFDKLYEEDFKDEAKNITEKNKAYIKEAHIIAIICFILSIGEAFYLFYSASHNPSPNLRSHVVAIVLFLGFAYIAFMIYANRSQSEYIKIIAAFFKEIENIVNRKPIGANLPLKAKQTFSNKIIKLLCDIFSIELKKTRGVSKYIKLVSADFLNEMTVDTPIIPSKIYDLYTEDSIEGTINNIDFKLADLKLNKRRSKYGTELYAYKGILIIFDLKEKFKNIGFQYGINKNMIMANILTLIGLAIYSCGIWFMLDMFYKLKNMPISILFTSFFLLSCFGTLYYLKKTIEPLANKKIEKLGNNFTLLSGDLKNFPAFFSKTLAKKTKILANNFSCDNIVFVIRNNTALVFVRANRDVFEYDNKSINSKGKVFFNKIKNELFSIIDFIDYFTKKLNYHLEDGINQEGNNPSNSALN